MTSPAVLRHPGTIHGIPSWVLLSPVATRVMRIAAIETRSTKVRLGFFHRTEAGGNSGRLLAEVFDGRLNNDRNTRRYGSGTPMNPAVLDYDDRLLDRGEKHQVMWSVLLSKNSITATRLDFAADLLKLGHNVTLCIMNDDLHVYVSTEHCRCSNCNPPTVTC